MIKTNRKAPAQRLGQSVVKTTLKHLHNNIFLAKKKDTIQKNSHKISDETILSKHNITHKAWFDKLNDDLYKVWEYEKAGNTIAYEYMHSSKQANLVNLHLWFNMSDKYYNQFVTYEEYKRVRADMDDCLQALEENKKNIFAKKMCQILTHLKNITLK